MTASIVISSHERLPLLRRTLWAIANRPPSCPFEVILVDDNSQADILGELRKYRVSFPWKFIQFDAAEFTARTGLTKFWNNSCPTNNIGWKYAEGDTIFLQGNEVLPVDDCYDRMLSHLNKVGELDLVFSTTFDMGPHVLEKLDEYGRNLSKAHVEACFDRPLHSEFYRSDVTNYISVSRKGLWDKIGGYDERYFAGISRDDSDFVRRARAAGCKTHICDQAVSLHQFHRGKTMYYNPPPSSITQERFEQGCAINRLVYESWDDSHTNPTPWPVGTYGIKSIITSQD